MSMRRGPGTPSKRCSADGVRAEASGGPPSAFPGGGIPGLTEIGGQDRRRHGPLVAPSLLRLLPRVREDSDGTAQREQAAPLARGLFALSRSIGILAHA